jgi:large subunit ribosomal protein L25
MAEITITGTARTEFGKGASRRDRRSGLVPAVIYGHGEAPRHVALPVRELGVALKTSNVLLDVVIDGKTELTLPKSVSRNPLTGALAHIDLVIVRRGERVKVEVPVHTIGKHDVDGILEHVHNTIEVEAEATSIPAFLEVNVDGLMAGQSKTAADVILPSGVNLVSDTSVVVVHLSERSTIVEEAPAAPVEGAEAEAAPEAEAPKEDSKQ